MATKAAKASKGKAATRPAATRAAPEAEAAPPKTRMAESKGQAKARSGTRAG